MHNWIAAAGIALLGLGAPASAFAQRFPFEQTIAVSGATTLDVFTVRGPISVTGGDPGRIVVRGAVTARLPWNLFADAVTIARQMAADPPIAQDGQTISLGTRSRPAEQHPVIVSYDVQIPPNTIVVAESDSGAITIRRVSGSLDIRTHSSAIEVTEIVQATWNAPLTSKLLLELNFDVYNVFNDDAVMAINQTYGAQWLRPISDAYTGGAILSGRLVQFGGRLRF